MRCCSGSDPSRGPLWWGREGGGVHHEKSTIEEMGPRPQLTVGNCGAGCANATNPRLAR